MNRLLQPTARPVRRHHPLDDAYSYDDLKDIFDDSEPPKTHAVKPGIKVHSYAELDQWFKVLGKARNVEESAEAESTEELVQQAEEIAPFVIVVPPGTGKTQHMKAAVDDKTLNIDGGKQLR